MSYNGIARTAGILFLLSMTASVVYTSVFAGAFDVPLSSVSGRRTHIVIGAMLELVNGFAVVGIAIALQAILRLYSRSIALAYVGLRAVECAVLVVGVVAGLTLISLSEALNASTAADEGVFEATAIAVLAGKEWALQMGILIAGVGGVLLTLMLYRHELVPRPISLLGLLGYVAVIASVILSLFDLIDTQGGLGRYFYLPGGLFEALVFPAWLITKGVSVRDVSEATSHSPDADS